MYDSIIILGPTASGKTKVSIELAKRLKTDIINADSMYIYKKLNIGTAKPSLEEMEGVFHHIIDVADPEDSFNVVDYRQLAEPIINSFKEKQQLPIIVGGTGFYIDSLIKNYSYGDVNADMSIRHTLEKELDEKGNMFLYEKLSKLDPTTAQKVHPNDIVRVIRALEICLSSGKSKTDCLNDKSPILSNPLIIGLNLPRESLYEKINKRVDLMIKDGLIDEVKALYESGLNPIEHQSMRGIGYKEIIEYLNGLCSLEFAIDKIKQHTRNYAKRQITWFKRNEQIIWLNPSDTNINDIVDKIIKYVNEKK
ncbi:MAG: tRNA (adenosine(37)-N6)-dimethylallyltransferase MiaA [Clostridia bacterium]|nr:tRNA (adenosine(37)-N6)-dimethylallyltransferase MiaA [Clostridia bacterium]